MIVPIRRLVDFGERWQRAVEFAPGLLETDLQRTDIDCSEPGRAAAAYAHQGIRNRRRRSAVVHVVGDQFALETVVRAKFPGPPEE